VYQVYVRHFSGAAPTNATVAIIVNAGTANARSATYFRTLSARTRQSVAM
jgi:hypothetical protein